MRAASLLTALALAAPAAAQEASRADAAWDVFLKTCPAALSDPETFAKSLPVPGPVGEKVFFQTDDGRSASIDTLIEGQPVSVSIVAVGTREERTCTLSLNDMTGSAPDMRTALLHEVFLRRTAALPDLDIVGGPMNKDIPVGAPMNTIFPSDDHHEYWIAGLLPGTDALAMVVLGDGFLTLYLDRTLRREDGS
ncbi:hypothetical protein [Oceaniglobus trochenteri]|uniref:hypothetical protein n=1 Tax=Oceaniglobus trochenteri TaxID=2763260 RepID=UPI001CFFC45F|nr:hypothetical protein [Oceaniglobus trochenteri]